MVTTSVMSKGVEHWKGIEHTMRLRSFIHNAITITTADDIVHRLVLAPVGEGWHEAVGVPEEVCDILQSVAKLPGEYVISEEEDSLQAEAEPITDDEASESGIIDSQESNENVDGAEAAEAADESSRKRGRQRKN